MQTLGYRSFLQRLAQVPFQYHCKTALGFAARNQISPGLTNWQDLIRIMVFMYENKKQYKFRMVKTIFDDKDICLESYSDSDWVGCLQTSKSTGGHIILFANLIVVVHSKRQTILARSSTEVELLAAYNCVVTTDRIRSTQT